MKKFARLLAVMAILFVSITPARAEHYVGLGLGLFELDSGAGKQKTFGSFVQLGNDFMPYLGAEIRLGATAKTSGNNEEMQLDWLVAHLLKPYFDVSDDFTLYGLAGFTVNHTSLRVGTANKLKKTNVSLSFGLGGEYAISKDFKLSAEWVRYATEKDASRRAANFQGLDVNGFVGSLKYEF
ncbi:MAG: porin family protein [Mariprofundaceae bacterium]|nr:porin family protein [Mariprofundaceae bacterium]